MNIRPVAPNDLMAWAQMRNELWPDSLNQHQKELEAFFLGKQFDIDYAYVLELDNAELAGFIEINIRDYAEGQGKFCYFVVAVEANNPLNFVDENGNAFSSRSNTACVVHEARMFIPSAFNPDSDIEENRVWMPQNIFAQEGSYQLEVYNRWGARVFSTANMNEGWDGMLNGGQAPMGVYSYVLKYKSLNGIPKEERGTFTLYRNKAN